MPHYRRCHRNNSPCCCYICTDGLVYPGYALGGGEPPKWGETNEKIQLSIPNAGNNAQILPVDVYFFNSTESGRRRVYVFTGISFARAVCLAGKISPYTPYCLNLGFEEQGVTGMKSLENFSQSDKEARHNNSMQIVSKFRDSSYNPCVNNTCYISVRRKVKIF